MKKIGLLFLLLTSLLSNSSIAQNFTIEESEALEREPVEGWMKLLYLSNGNTALIHFTEEQGIELRVYGTDRKLLLEQVARPQYNSKGAIHLDKSKIEGVFSFGADLVSFINIYSKEGPTLYRVIIDLNTGKLKSEEAIATLMPEKKVSTNYFVVRKDENSDNYAVAVCNRTEFDKNKQIKISYYNGTHKNIAESYFVAPINDFKAFDLVDMYVFSSKKVVALARSYGKEEDQYGLYIGALEAGSDYFVVKEKEAKELKWIQEGALRFDAKNNNLVLLSLSAYRRGFDIYFTNIVIFNSDNLDTKFIKTLDLPDVELNYITYGQTSKRYTGIPQNLVLNDDGTYSIVYEIKFTRSKGNIVEGTGLGGAVVSVLSPELKTLKSTLIAKGHWLTGAVDDLLPYSNENKATKLFVSNHYKSIAYVDGATGKYAIYNDFMENEKKIEETGKLRNLNGVTDTDAFYINCSPDAESHKKTLLYGENATARDHKFTMVGVSAFDKQSHTYITLKLVQSREGKKLKVVWIKM
ncbi:hypothetical protein [Fulvivirga ligni]|uniref:hypothetical protein n=1 Tax=Fulvivirga ligni TaxID=2904246 RepID=UPI001F1C7A19|nr:hypothetical protein [Fulvivirga ligni]UII23331.1 hypothetical protein LVD16_08840 [Fulvivirga ligni]